MFPELDIVLDKRLALLLHLPQYINNEINLGRGEKAKGLLGALLHPLFKFAVAFFCEVFAVMSATSKKVQPARGAQVDVVWV